VVGKKRIRERHNEDHKVIPLNMGKKSNRKTRVQGRKDARLGHKRNVSGKKKYKVKECIKGRSKWVIVERPRKDVELGGAFDTPRWEGFPIGEVHHPRAIRKRRKTDVLMGINGARGRAGTWQEKVCCVRKLRRDDRPGLIIFGKQEREKGGSYNVLRGGLKNEGDGEK